MDHASSHGNSPTHVKSHLLYYSHCTIYHLGTRLSYSLVLISRYGGLALGLRLAKLHVAVAGTTCR